MDVFAKVHRRARRLWNYRRIERVLRGKRGLEIGGPSAVFSPATPNGFIPPVYAIAASVDNCNFATNTTWSHGEAGRTFRYLPDAEPGMQYIHDATDLASVTDGSYDFLLASHILEHVANPLRALQEFHRVLKPQGLLLLILPNQVYTFDHRRPPTTFAHLEADLAAGTDESDMTHLNEILALHDLDLDKPAGSPEEFRERCLRNLNERCMHHHVFSLGVLERAARQAQFQPLYLTDAWPGQLMLFGRKT
jgi:SAM-dependent methyltransferase